MSASSSIHVAALGVAYVVFTLSVPSAGHAQTTRIVSAGDVRLAIREVSSAVVAQQLGVKLSPTQPEELAVGTSLTGSLTDPARLAVFGIADARAGARVTMMRVGEQRLLVEVDEIEPVTRTRRVTLRLRADGQLGVLAP